MARFDGSIIFLDGFNRKTSRTYGIEAIDYAAAQAAMAGLVVVTLPILEAGIVKTRVWQDVDVATVVVPGANKDAGLTMIWELTPLGSEKLAASKLPAPVDDIFDANGNLDLNDSGVIAYRAVMIGGEILISDGEVPADLKKGSLDK